MVFFLCLKSVYAQNKQDLEYLSKIILTADSSLINDFNHYLSFFDAKITSEKQMWEFFDFRDTLLKTFTPFMENYYYNMSQDEYKKWNFVNDELESIGFKVIYAEGMFAGLNIKAIRKNEIKKYCSDAFKLYADFRYKYSSALGGEYPFINPKSYFDAVYAAEKLLLNYRNTQYFFKIEEKYKEALFICTDIHGATTTNGLKNYYYGDFNFSFYPYVSSWSDIEYIKNDYPNSIYHNIFSNLLQNMSDIIVQQGKPDEVAVVYVVVTDKTDSYKESQNRIFDYLNSGLDIVHNLKIKNGNNLEYYIAYRFYSNKDRADKALEKIKDKVDEAKIIEVVVPAEFEYAQIRSNR